MLALPQQVADLGLSFTTSNRLRVVASAPRPIRPRLLGTIRESAGRVGIDYCNR